LPDFQKNQICRFQESVSSKVLMVFFMIAAAAASTGISLISAMVCATMAAWEGSLRLPRNGTGAR